MKSNVWVPYVGFHPLERFRGKKMMEIEVDFDSDGLKLAGVLHIPKDRPEGERRPGFLVLHGFGGSKNGPGMIAQAKALADWGYVTLRFDMRGLGNSEGERGRVLCFDQVADTKNALTWLAKRAEVDGARIGLIGHSFGAAVAVYTGGIDERVAAVISSGGWGDGARKFRGQHSSPEAWARFTTMLEDGRRQRRETGQSLMVPRWDIVPIPEHLRANLAKDSFMEFPAETAQSMFDFRADEVVGNIAPRPLLLLHSANDSVTPTEQSIELFKRAGPPAELILLASMDHFTAENSRAAETVKGWLGAHFPLRA